MAGKAGFTDSAPSAGRWPSVSAKSRPQAGGARHRPEARPRPCGPGRRDRGQRRGGGSRVDQHDPDRRDHRIRRREVIAGERGIIKGAKPSHIVVSCRPSILFAARDRRAARAKGIPMVDARAAAPAAPVGRAVGDRGRRQGDRRRSAETCSRRWGNRTFHVGPLGNGLAMKLVNNMLVQVNTVAVAEALVLEVRAEPRSRRPSTRWCKRLDRRQCGLVRCVFRASSRATTSPAARSTSPTRTRSSRPPLPSAWACRCCSATSRSRSTRWPAHRGSTGRTARRSKDLRADGRRESEGGNQMTTFVLIHGAYQGGWI